MAIALNNLFSQFDELIWRVLLTMGDSCGVVFSDAVSPFTSALAWCCIVVIIVCALAIPFTLLYKLIKLVTGDIYK